jgi:futalosine hydrolase
LGLGQEKDYLIYRNSGRFEHYFSNLQKVTAISKNTISTKDSTMSFLKKQYEAQVESMEGAAFHYVCANFNVSFCQIRSISNYVGERNKINWDIKGAVTVLNDFLFKSFIDTH